jgi:hypothetical protein
LWFSSIPPSNFGIVYSNQTTTTSFQILSNSSFTYYPSIRRLQS